jgi:tRNA nucleotidyltransferase (CCA-adding enzyme)
VLAILRGGTSLAAIAAGDNSRRQQYFLFKAAGHSIVALLLVGLAEGLPAPILENLMARFLDNHDPIAHPYPLISGRDLIQYLGLLPGPHIGELLAAIELAHAEGQLTSPEEALAWAAQSL